MIKWTKGILIIIVQGYSILMCLFPGGGTRKNFDRNARSTFWGLKFDNLLFWGVAQNEGYFWGG